MNLEKYLNQCFDRAKYWDDRPVTKAEYIDHVEQARALFEDVQNAARGLLQELEGPKYQWRSHDVQKASQWLSNVLEGEY